MARVKDVVHEERFSDMVSKIHDCKREIPYTDTGRYLVYILYLDNECVYVGQSHSGLSRPYAHKLDKTFNKMYIIECPEEELNDVEALMIAEHRPICNRGIPSNSVMLSKNKLKPLLCMNGFQLNSFIRENKIKAFDGYQATVYYWGDFCGRW